jgi:SHS family sialic acid transporter-like MFS transporter
MATNATGEASQHLTSADWKGFWAAWLGYFLDGFDFILITLVLTEVAKEFHLSLIVASTLVSAAFVSRWLGGLILGALGDRFGRKPAMMISIVCFSVGSLLCGFAWDYWSLFVFRAVVGLGMAGEYGSSATYVMESWPQRLRNRASGALLSAYPVGVIATSLLYVAIVPHFGWRWLFYIGVIPVLLTLVMRRTLPEAKEWSEQVEGADKPVATTFDILFKGKMRWPNIGLCVVIAFCLVMIFTANAGGLTWLYALVAVAGFIGFAFQLERRVWPMLVMLMITVCAAFLYSWPIQSLLPTYLKTDLGYDAGQVSAVLSWAGLGYALGSICSGMLGDRLGTRKAYVVGLLVSLVLVFPVFLIGGGNMFLLAILLFVLQFTSQGISGLLPKYVGDHFPTRLRAAGLGFTYNVGALGGAISPLIGTYLSTTIGSLGTALLVLSSSFTVIMVILVGFNVAARVGHAVLPQGDPEIPVLAEFAENK